MIRTTAETCANHYRPCPLRMLIWIYISIILLLIGFLADMLFRETFHSEAHLLPGQPSLVSFYTPPRIGLTLSLCLKSLA